MKTINEIQAAFDGKRIQTLCNGKTYTDFIIDEVKFIDEVRDVWLIKGENSRCEEAAMTLTSPQVRGLTACDHVISSIFGEVVTVTVRADEEMKMKVRKNEMEYAIYEGSTGIIRFADDTWEVKKVSAPEKCYGRGGVSFLVTSKSGDLCAVFGNMRGVFNYADAKDGEVIEYTQRNK